MDRTVPKGAAILLDFVRKTETGRSDRASYDVIYGHKQGKLAKPITSMTLDEVVAAQSTWSHHHGSSAAGGYQFIRKTLRGLVAELGLRGSQRFDPDLQDRLAWHLLKRRGYDKFMSGRMTKTEFAKQLACEWASFPVLQGTQGQKRYVARGQSYYAGDGLNKALVEPRAIESLLDRVSAISDHPEPPAPSIPQPPAEPEREHTAKQGRSIAPLVIFLTIAAIVGAASYLGL
ncbi:hypothetical protein [Chelativorans sp. YIM 93263]|uniref:hypothetical protein n=1 Tax=Chelativorans sp. YIM 93263 TaxID=2906648 RepID=UPI002377D53A|nr:hypothetical protein [Chelativorans sp. YIM 93263]